MFIRFTTPKIKSSINYSYSQSFDEQNVFIPEISRHTGNAGITYSFNKYLKLNLRANYTGKRKNPKTITSTDSRYVEPYLVFNGALSFINYNGFRCQLTAKNIFNKEYYHTSNRDPDRYRQPQRTTMLSISYEMRK
jgi:outer membrane receptor for ferrienterochelin and colicin